MFPTAGRTSFSPQQSGNVPTESLISSLDPKSAKETNEPVSKISLFKYASIHPQIVPFEYQFSSMKKNLVPVNQPYRFY